MPRAARPRRPTTREHYAALAARLRPDDWTPAGVSARCAHLVLTLLKRDVPAATLDALWPDVAPNARRSLGPWVRAHAEYVHLAKTTERDATTTPANDAAVQQAMVDGITEQPAYVTCADGVVRAVYPKSLGCHFALSALDQYVADPATAPMDRLRAIRQWIWIVTTPGWLAPFDLLLPIEQWPAPTGDACAWFGAMTEYDLLALVQAYNAVDRHAVALMLSAFPQRGQGDTSRLALAGFFGAVAKERDLTKHSAKYFIATTLSDATLQEEGRVRAEQEARTARTARAS